MGQLIIDHVPDELEARLRQRAELTGRPVEALVLEILAGADLRAPRSIPNLPLSSAIAQRIAEIGLTQEDWEELDRSLEAIRGSRRDEVHRRIDFTDAKFDT